MKHRLHIFLMHPLVGLRRKVLKMKCHYQMVKTIDKANPFKIFEAYSFGKYLEMVNPTPVLVIGQTPEELTDLSAAINRDIEVYGTVGWPEAKRAMDKYTNYVVAPTFDDVDDEEEYEYNDNVVDIVDFMKRNGAR